MGSTYPNRKFLQKASTSCLCPSQLQKLWKKEGGRSGREGEGGAGSNWIMWEKVEDGLHLDTFVLSRGNRGSTKSTKTDITSVMKTN